MEYNFKKIEHKWITKWEESKIFESKIRSKSKFYCLEMYPYPSSKGLHMGHAFNYTIVDIYSRFKRMNGFSVLYSPGYDSFGLPAENAAIKAGEHPKNYTNKAISNFMNQQKSLGLSYDWSRVLWSHNPDYYRWNQYFFLKFFEKGLAYRKKAPVNWCPKCETVLANEQVHEGKCWRHEKTDVEVKHLEQWFIKTTEYADEILEMINNLKWPERIKLMQKNWIGKSHGVEIDFKINNEIWPVFTTRPDTLFGVTFMVISAQHESLMKIVTDKQKKKVENFLKKIKTTKQEDISKLDKEGVFTGSYAINPINNEKIPIYIGNFVLADYGSGIVMAVPAHDKRDFEFAKKYDLPIKIVIRERNTKKFENEKEIPESYQGEGILMNSGEFNGLESKKAIEKIIEYLEKKKIGKKQIQFKLKDWLVSRQRYWGTPIPIIYCDKCGIVPVSEKDLPVSLPEKVKFGQGNPLENNKDFVETDCPKCGNNARRETDTMDTFFDSCWYYLRFCDSKNLKKPFDSDKVNYWMPVDFYTGGVEHACMHLIYARFFTKVLRDLGYLNFDEPFERLFNQGLIHGEDGYKMSKSRGNIVDPTEIIAKYGADSLRFSLISFSSPDKDFEWDENVLSGSFRFMKRLYDYFEKAEIGETDERIESKLNKTIKNVTEYIENLKYNLAIIEIRKLFNSLPKKTSKEVLEKFLKLMNPFCPHVTEEIWENLGNKEFLSLSKWPKSDEKKINEEFEKQDEILDKLISDLNQIKNLVREKEISKAYIYVLPNEKEWIDERKKFIEEKTKLNANIFSVDDKEKYDPENKSKKAKPGKPGIYLE